MPESAQRPSRETERRGTERSAPTPRPEPTAPSSARERPPAPTPAKSTAAAATPAAPRDQDESAEGAPSGLARLRAIFAGRVIDILPHPEGDEGEGEGLDAEFALDASHQASLEVDGAEGAD